jgi:glucokinase
MEYYLGIDIGATSAKLGIVNTNGEVFEQGKASTGPEITNELFLEGLINAIDEIFTKKQYNIKAIGIGAPSPIDNEKGILLFTGNMPNVKNLPLKKELEGRYKVPVFIENDANLAGLGEFHFGKAKNYQDVLFYTLGTGIGGGYISRGSLVKGFKGNSMEIGHTCVRLDGALCSCGRKGCLEAYAGFSGIHRQLKKIFPNTDLPYNLKDLLTIDEIRDELIKKLNLAGTYLGISAANFINLVVPEMIIITGGISAAWEYFEKPFYESLEKTAFPILREQVKIEILEKEGTSGIKGGAALAILSKDSAD